MPKIIEKTVRLFSFTWDKLDTPIKDLIDKAKVSAENAHAPYSNFLVGAALLLENGTIVTGNNQENASFPAGICAERVAMSYAQATYPDIRPVTIAIVAKKMDQENYADVTPCGICRQTICEYEEKFKKPIEIYMLNSKEEVYKAAGIDDLLPFKFTDF